VLAGGDHVERLGLVAGRDARRLVDAVALAALKVRRVHGVAANGDLVARRVDGLVTARHSAAGRADVEVVRLCRLQTRLKRDARQLR
jgi:hypothetical protein